jgi:hypothetical protein
MTECRQSVAGKAAPDDASIHGSVSHDELATAPAKSVNSSSPKLTADLPLLSSVVVLSSPTLIGSTFAWSAIDPANTGACSMLGALRVANRSSTASRSPLSHHMPASNATRQYPSAGAIVHRCCVGLSLDSTLDDSFPCTTCARYAKGHTSQERRR